MPNPPRATRAVPASPNLEQQKKQARELIAALRRGDAQARQRFRDVHPALAASGRDRPEGGSSRLALHDAQLVIAREYGFTSWGKLKKHIETVAAPANRFELLASAVKEGDVDAARDILLRHSRLRTRLDEAMPGGDFGQTMIGHAANRENLELIDLLLAHGANINQRSHWWAGSFGVLDGGKPAFAARLIERGAFVDAHAASRLGRLERLDALVSADPSVVHARGGDGQTPLHFAANVDVARYLFEHGANVDARDLDHESTPAQWMIRDRHDVAGWLVEHGASADILMASALGDVDRVREHLDHHPASIRTRVNGEYFPMSNPRAGGSIYVWALGANKLAHSVARDFGRTNVYELLIDRMPDTMRLVLLCEAGDERAARELVARQPNLVERAVSEDPRRLGDMAWDGNTEAALLMLDLGWPVNVGGREATPLHQAAWTGNVALVRELTRRRADLNARETQFNATPLGWAEHGAGNNGGRGDSEAVIEMLREAETLARSKTR